MKSSEIKPGVVYAYSTSRWGAKVPLIVLDSNYRTRSRGLGRVPEGAWTLALKSRFSKGDMWTSPTGLLAIQWSRYGTQPDEAKTALESTYAKVDVTKILSGEKVDLPDGVFIHVIDPRGIEETWDEYQEDQAVTKKIREANAREAAEAQAALESLNQKIINLAESLQVKLDRHVPNHPASLSGAELLRVLEKLSLANSGPFGF